MAASTLTYTTLVSTVWGDRQVRIVSISFSDDYVAGGFTLTPALFGLVKIDAVLPFGSSPLAEAAYVAAFDRATSSLLLYGTNNDADRNPLEELDTADDITDSAVTVLVIGH